MSAHLKLPTAERPCRYVTFVESTPAPAVLSGGANTSIPVMARSFVHMAASSPAVWGDAMPFENGPFGPSKAGPSPE
jgi:hypothetical protein